MIIGPLKLHAHDWASTALSWLGSPLGKPSCVGYGGQPQHIASLPASVASPPVYLASSDAAVSDRTPFPHADAHHIMEGVGHEGVLASMSKSGTLNSATFTRGQGILTHRTLTVNFTLPKSGRFLLVILIVIPGNSLCRGSNPMPGTLF